MCLIISGTGRCGTLYTVELLQRLGVRAGHESKDHSKFEVVVGYHNILRAGRDDTIWMLIREPLECIASLSHPSVFRDHQWAEITSNCMASGSKYGTHMAMKYWLFWTVQCEAIAEKVIRIEDMGEEVYSIMSYLNKPVDDKKFIEAMQQIPKNLNTNKPARRKAKQRLCWTDLAVIDTHLFMGIERVALRHGYISD